MKFTKLRALLAAGLIAILGLGYAARAASPIQLGGSIFPLTFITQSPLNLADGFNQMEALVNAQVVASQQLFAPFNTTTTGNPLVQQVNANFQVSVVNSASLTGGTLIQGISARTVWPGIPVMTVSGTAAGATAERIMCSPSGTIIATFPIAALVNANPVLPTSAGSTLGAGFYQGCSAGDSVMVSTQGANLTTTTNVFVNMPYTLQ